jgi:hypothetical protein
MINNPYSPRAITMSPDSVAVPILVIGTGAASYIMVMPN